jgi:hypothetical protein
MLFNRDSTIQKCFRSFCIAFKSEDFGSLSAVQMTCHPVRTPICPLFHLFGRCAIPSGHPTDQASSVRTKCFFRPDLHCFEKLLFQLAFVWTSQQPVRTPLNDRSVSDSFQIQFKGRLFQLLGRRGFLSGRAHT